MCSNTTSPADLPSASTVAFLFASISPSAQTVMRNRFAGRHRFLTPRSKIGFHAVFTEASGQQDVSSAGNALVGSYLQQLNLNPNTIVYATDTSPTSMQWLPNADAKRIGFPSAPWGFCPTRPHNSIR
ncbi:exported hypothetical protein [Rhizobium mesoamericanum STM3625]|uniref:Uncharacterized protein n=1 Tax=Rhizobium mesoamericanum STM3625 TaxID=1211777 RepID=K0PZQ0_9HYPH|nr:exported hypothetical protein [Rhizobium mesoamericanum STM3625]